ncbi:MAG TPA: aldo/keto reductase [Xanthobacteraceae bacterium]|nr:aldo/keto reductase [Xanthobacteraceae bacterium]
MLKSLPLPSGRAMPVLGQGTWGMGEQHGAFKAEVAALKLGLDLGIMLIDTAEMYGEGGAEKVVAEAIAGRRDEVCLVSKLYPHNASRSGAVAACERSLKRLKTDHLDVYLLHWRGGEPLAETLEAFAVLKQTGKILDYGVSNFDTDDMEEAAGLPGGSAVATNQVLYNLMNRGIEWDLLPWCRSRGIPVMAYSPFVSAPPALTRLLGNTTLKAVASRHAATPAQIALAWLVHQPGVVAIPKAVQPAHVRANRAAHDLTLTPDDLGDLDGAFPPPRKKVPLAML